FDLVLANPPYYAAGTIARLFVQRARDLLKADGRLFLVTKQPNEVGEVVMEVFGAAEAVMHRGYTVLVGGPKRAMGASGGVGGRGSGRAGCATGSAGASPSLRPTSNTPSDQGVDRLGVVQQGLRPAEVVRQRGRRVDAEDVVQRGQHVLRREGAPHGRLGP